MRILWKILCAIETLTKQFPQAWDTIMPHRIFFQSSLSFRPIKCPYPYCAGSVHRKHVQNWWHPFKQCTWFLKILWKKTFWKLSFFCQSKNTGKKACPRQSRLINFFFSRPISYKFYPLLLVAPQTECLNKFEHFHF